MGADDAIVFENRFGFVVNVAGLYGIYPLGGRHYGDPKPVLYDLQVC